MQITRTNPNKTETKLVIKATAEEIAKAKEIVLKKMAPNVSVPGFRKGHVPSNIVEKNVDQNSLQQEVIEETLNKLYASAVRQEDLRPVANPEIQIKKFVPFNELEFEAVIATIGDIKLGDYKKIKTSKPEVKITKEDVDNVIESLRGRVAQYEEVKRVAKDGDQVVINFKGTDAKGKPVAGAEGNDYPLTLGGKQFIPGFEEELIGLKAGEDKTFDIKFPADYGVKALQGKKVTFEVTINRVNSVKLPPIDDEFAAAIGPFKAVSELKDDIKKQVEIERLREVETAYENELIEKIAAKTAIEIPDMLVEEQIDRIEQEEKQNVIYRGQTWEEHLSEEGVTAEEHREHKRPAAEQRVKIGIMLSEIAEAEKIEVSSQELEVRLQMLKAQYTDAQAQEDLNKPEALRSINSQIMTEKTLEKLKEYAKS